MSITAYLVLASVVLVLFIVFITLELLLLVKDARRRLEAVEKELWGRADVDATDQNRSVHE